MSLAQRTVTSISWNAVSSIARVGVGFVRSVILARLLAVEIFGVYRGVSVVIALSIIFFRFGLNGALIHRSEQSEDEQQAAAVHFTLVLILSAIWYVLVVIYTLVVVDEAIRAVWLVMAASTVLVALTTTGRVILIRRVVHRRLALLDTVALIVASVVAVVFAWQGMGIWALISTDVTMTILSMIGLYLYRPVWKPRLSLYRPTVRYFLSFGSKNMWNGVFYIYLDRIDDFWTSVFLGDYAMGLYSRAYTFASYPRNVLATPINSVAIGTYAELKQDRKRLSQSFFQINALLVRSGFAFAGILALIAPEFIRILIGVKWMPFLDTFRLMLIFTLLDPMKTTVGSLFVAIGRPEIAARARGFQLIVLIIGLAILAPLYGIAGVAVAVNIMLVMGIGIMLWQAQRFVDFSIVRLFAAPTFALALGLVVGRLSILIPGIMGSDWRTSAVKLVSFLCVYVSIMLLFEREQLLRIWTMIMKMRQAKKLSDAS